MITDRLSAAMLATLAGATLSLHTAAPTVAAPAELAGGSYARAALVLTPAVAGEVTNRDRVRFANLPASTVTHAGLWLGASLVWAFALTRPVDLAPGDGIEFEPGNIPLAVKEAA